MFAWSLEARVSGWRDLRNRPKNCQTNWQENLNSELWDGKSVSWSVCPSWHPTLKLHVKFYCSNTCQHDAFEFEHALVQTQKDSSNRNKSIRTSPLWSSGRSKGPQLDWSDGTRMSRVSHPCSHDVTGVKWCQGCQQVAEGPQDAWGASHP